MSYISFIELTSAITAVDTGKLSTFPTLSFAVMLIPRTMSRIYSA